MTLQEKRNQIIKLIKDKDIPRPILQEGRGWSYASTTQYLSGKSERNKLNEDHIKRLIKIIRSYTGEINLELDLIEGGGKFHFKKTDLISGVMDHFVENKNQLEKECSENKYKSGDFVHVHDDGIYRIYGNG